MRRSRGPNRDAVLVTWVSVNHGPAPLLTALDDPASPLRGRTRAVYLCWRNAPSPDGDRERVARAATVEALRAGLSSAGADLEEMPWKTTAPPTDHLAIRSFAEDVLRRVRDRHSEAHIYILITPGTPAMHAVWLVLGTTGFITEPVTLIQTADPRGQGAGQAPVTELRFELDTWLRHYRQSRPRSLPNDDDGQLWDPARVRSQALRRTLEKLERWAPLRAPVLLIGERGTGKTTLANFLRAMSPFQKKGKSGWPVVVCGQFRVNRELARSELFGHASGAFTGAAKERAGLLEEADGDTLFLDEIADIDHDTQRLLMAAIEGRGFHRLGDARVRNSRFRLVSATNRPLEMLAGGVLDPDFFDRIAVFTLRVPPLRECREDLPHLWRSVLGRAAELADVITVTGWRDFLEHKTLLRAFERHPLPGNLRDLQRVAFHLLAALHAGEAPERAAEDALTALPTAEPMGGLPDVSALRARLPLAEGLQEHLAAYRRCWEEAALAEADDNQSEAARLLGVKRETFKDWRKTQ